MNKLELCKKLAGIPLPKCSVSFKSDDKTLEKLMEKAEALAKANIVQFSPDMQALIEGGGYSSVYTETQPMGGEMYAKRNPRVALNNQLLFMLCQRADGRLPGRVISIAQGKVGDWKNNPVYMYSSGEWESLGLLADFGQLQGNAFPYPAFKMYYLAGKPEGYLQMLADCLEAFDAYLWRTRNPDSEGVLQSWCVWDTGEDHCFRFGGSPNRWPHDYPPAGERTSSQSDPGDRERYYQWSSQRELTEKIRVPLRCMHYGVFDQEMADEFIRRHLFNPEEFFTPVPLPSIAANDPLFRNIADNNWSGQAQGLTWQRAIRALENYGRYSELTMLGRKYLKVLKTAGVLTQQFDPFDAENPAKDNKQRDGYGSTILGFMEYVSRFFGIHLEQVQVYWSGLADSGSVEYIQQFGDRTFTLRNDGSVFTGAVNGKGKFTCSCGVRIHTDMEGNPVQIIGLDTVPHVISFKSGKINCSIEVMPNQVWSFEKGKAVFN
jgi:hypothetical protein